MTVRGVPLLDLRRGATEIDSELEDAFRRVLKSGQYILGPEVEAFEGECAGIVGVKHAIGVSSGTDALLLALMALGIQAGDEVICPSYTFFATAGVVWRLGAQPVFIDIEPCCYNASVSSISARITPRTKAIIPVHLFGQCADMDPVLAVARAHGIAVVEDAAQAIGARYGGRAAGSMADFGAFSFFPSKNIGALGDAGLLVTNNDSLAERARILRTHGGSPKYHHQVVGGNFRIDALQAALLRVKLRRLEEATRRRQSNARLYGRLFLQEGIAGPNSPRTCSGRALGATSGKVMLPSECQDVHVYNQYIIRMPGDGTRDRLRTFLSERRIGTEIYYPVPMHLQQCFSSLRERTGVLPESESAARETLALPIFPELTDVEIGHVVKQISSFFS